MNEVGLSILSEDGRAMEIEIVELYGGCC
jgi:hypothetical protein